MEEEQKKEEKAATPHVLIFPLPAQGHINSMLKLAELLCLAGFHVTFLNTDHNHDRLLRFADVHTRLSSLPRFRFRTISDGLPADHPRSASKLMDLFDALQAHTKPLFREFLVSCGPGSKSRKPVTCVIADGVMTFTIDVAKDVGIPIIAFRTISACAFWAYYCIPRLIEGGELPFKHDEDMDQPIRGVPGMESFLRCRDLPSFLQCKDITDPVLQLVNTETLNTTRASALILNTFEHLEASILSQIRKHFPLTYTIGPLHALLKSRASSNSSSSSSSSSLLKEDKTCMTWLDSQPHKSVIYVSFGSFATVTRRDLLEIWYGLVNSGKQFLWVIRSDSISGEDERGQIPEELEEETKQRGFLVEWAPQEAVLAHPAVGGFLTHGGWNSTLESIYAGVPMICWPFFADQQINSRFVGEVWKDGLDMKDKCDRETVEKMVREVMQWKREELVRSADEMAELARISVSQVGSSYNNLEKLIEDIRYMSI